jgi:hypothetical protein
MMKHPEILGGRVMRRIVLAVILILALAAPAMAATGSIRPAGNHLNLPVRLASTSTPVPWFSSGVIAGRFGGVPVVGSYTGTSAIGIVTMTTHGATFAYGGYACLHKSCTFTGILAGVRVKGFPIPLNIRGAAKAATSAFPTRRAWIAAVAGWAKRHLTRDQGDRVVAEADKIPGS